MKQKISTGIPCQPTLERGGIHGRRARTDCRDLYRLVYRETSLIHTPSINLKRGEPMLELLGLIVLVWFLVTYVF